MFPLRCDTEQKRFPAATLLIIAACCVVYIMQLKGYYVFDGFVPLDFVYSLFHPGKTTLIAMGNCIAAFFMHANILHLVGNIWYLWIFGAAVENRSGFFRFILLYTVCGAISMIVQAAYSPLSSIPVIGASGAIAGVMGLHFALVPRSRILVWIPIFFLIRVPAFIFLLLWFVVQYVNAGSSGSTHVAWWAHIGGFIAGVMWGFYLRIKLKPGTSRRKVRSGTKKTSVKTSSGAV